MQTVLTSNREHFPCRAFSLNSFQYLSLSDSGWIIMSGNVWFCKSAELFHSQKAKQSSRSNKFCVDAELDARTLKKNNGLQMKQTGFGSVYRVDKTEECKNIFKNLFLKLFLNGLNVYSPFPQILGIHTVLLHPTNLSTIHTRSYTSACKHWRKGVCCPNTQVCSCRSQNLNHQPSGLKTIYFPFLLILLIVLMVKYLNQQNTVFW